MNTLTNKPGVIIIEGHVQGLANTRALGREGIPVIVVDKHNCIARYSKYCTAFYRCPEYRSDEFASFLIDLAKSRNLEGWSLIPSNDHAVHTISRFKTELEEFYKVITPGLEIINKIYKKSNLLSIAESIDIPIPLTFYPKEIKDLDTLIALYSLMVKGKEGLTFYKATGRKVFIAHSLPELKSIYNGLPETIRVEDTFIQEIIPSEGPNKTISFTAFCIDGEIKSYWTGIKLREHPAKFGTATFCESILNPEVYGLGKKLLKELNYTGVSEVEFLLDKHTNQYKLIEINARTWLWVGLAIKCGINYPLMIYNYLNQIEMEYPESYKVGVQWVNRVTDFIYSFKSKISDLFESKKSQQQKVQAIYSPDDKMPSVMFLIMLPYIILKR